MTNGGEMQSHEKKSEKKLQITLKMMLFFCERTAIIYYV